MNEEDERRFTGFSPKTLRFLRGLKANNNKAWFQTHRDEYEEYVLGPLRDLVTDLGDYMLDIDDTLFSSKLVDDLVYGFNMIAPFYRYLQRITLVNQDR